MAKNKKQKMKSLKPLKDSVVNMPGSEASTEGSSVECSFLCLSSSGAASLFFAAPLGLHGHRGISLHYFRLDNGDWQLMFKKITRSRRV